MNNAKIQFIWVFSGNVQELGDGKKKYKKSDQFRQARLVDINPRYSLKIPDPQFFDAPHSNMMSEKSYQSKLKCSVSQNGMTFKNIEIK